MLKDMIFSTVGGLGLFLFGMGLMSDGLKKVAGAKLKKAATCRPYHFEEDQQVVQKELKASADTGKVTVEIPPFRYHTMVLFRTSR